MLWLKVGDGYICAIRALSGISYRVSHAARPEQWPVIIVIESDDSMGGYKRHTLHQAMSKMALSCAGH